MHTAAQGIQPAGAGHRHHPQYRQPHRAEGQPQHGGPGLGARLGRNIGRKNQIARPKNMENRVKPTRSRSLPSSRLSFSLTVVSFPAI